MILWTCFTNLCNMAIKRSSNPGTEFSMASLTDMIFLLLIFFLLSSSFITPNALKLLLPKANNPAQAKQTVSVSIDKNLQYYVNATPVTLEELPSVLKTYLTGDASESIVLNVDQSVPAGELVKVMMVGQKFNAKVVLATSRE